jgi:hypothetical protein
VQCENHKNETLWKSTIKRIVLAEKKHAKKTRQNSEEEKKTTKHGGRSKVEREKRKIMQSTDDSRRRARGPSSHLKKLLQIWMNSFDVAMNSLDGLSPVSFFARSVSMW